MWHSENDVIHPLCFVNFKKNYTLFSNFKVLKYIFVRIIVDTDDVEKYTNKFFHVLY